MVAETIQLPNMRKMFIPDSGMVMLEGDLARADAQVVAWDANDESLKAIFRAGLDIHTENARMVYNILEGNNPTKMQRHRCKAGVHACYDGDTELLTKLGWVKFKYLSKGVKVAQWKDNIISFVLPTRYFEDPYEGEMYHFGGRVDLFVTPNHRCLVYETTHDKYSIKRADKVPTTSGTYRHITAGKFQGGYTQNKDFVRYLVMLQADGCIRPAGSALFDFKKKRKIERFLDICLKLDIHFSEHKARKGFRVFLISFKEEVQELALRYLGKSKTFGSWLLTFDRESMETFINELKYWDGWPDKKDSFQYTSRIEDNIKWVQTISHLVDRRGAMFTNSKGYKTIHVSKTSKVSIHLHQPRKVHYKGVVYCVEVPSGMLLTKRNNLITVCGNTNYVVAAKTLAATLQCTIREAQNFIDTWFRLHPAVKEWHRRIEMELAETRTVTNIFGFKRIYFDKVELLLPKATAWIGQSTVAITINKGMINVRRNFTRTEVKILLQIHDSVLFQVHKEDFPEIVIEIEKVMLISIPYPDPLIIPVTFKASAISWGDQEELSLEELRGKVT